MNKGMENKKAEFARLLDSILDSVSIDRETAAECLREEGLNPEKIEDDIMKEIRKAMFQIDVKKTEEKQRQSSLIRLQAKEKTHQLMNLQGFSFNGFVKEHGMVMHCRNLEKLTEKDKKEAIEKFYYLELLKTTEEKIEEQ